MDFNALANAHDAFNLPQVVILHDTLKASEASWNTVLTDWVKAIGVGSLITGVMMFCVARGQLKIAKYQHVLARNQLKLTKAQFKLAEEQANTSKEQKEIAKQKLKLDLFELRYDCHKAFKDLYSEFKIRIFDKNFDFLYGKYGECNSVYNEMVILFSPEVCQSAVNVLAIMVQICDLKSAEEQGVIDSNKYLKDSSKCFENLIKSFTFEYQEKIKSFLEFEGLD